MCLRRTRPAMASEKTGIGYSVKIFNPKTGLYRDIYSTPTAGTRAAGVWYKARRVHNKWRMKLTYPYGFHLFVYRADASSAKLGCQPLETLLEGEVTRVVMVQYRKGFLVGQPPLANWNCPVIVAKEIRILTLPQPIVTTITELDVE